ncbi:MAG: sugar ABC transporter permease [Spirochaetia bacterium]|jgi:multiple sugar transport system permease protein|nr:sugar ABC transporter permease [Spirochaetia bacterium]
MKSLKQGKKIRDNIVGWLFVLPAFVFLFSFMIYPISRTFILSFQKFNFVYDSKPVFVGLSNYVEALKTPSYLTALKNTLRFTLWYIPVIIVLGFLFGYIITLPKLFSSKLAKIVLFVPMVIPISMSCYMFLFILNPQWGLVNSFLANTIHLPMLVRDWMNDPRYALKIIIVVTVWQRIGFISLLFMSGIQGISSSIMEAAIIDGASAARRMWSIVLPNLKETFQIVGILAIITSIKLFAQVVAMTGALGPNSAGGPANSTLTLYVATWKAAFINFDMGVGSAMGYLMSLIIFLLFGLNFMLTKSERA